MMSQNGYHLITLHGVAKKNVRFYTDVQGNEMANVAVPWKDSRSGMGNIDVRKQDVRLEKSSYAVNLPNEMYGVWHIDKDGNAQKPTVRSGRLFAVYENNRQQYRQSRINKEAGNMDNIQENVPVEDKEMLDFG